jgi:hypothetical protein
MALIKEDIIAALADPNAADYKVLVDTLGEKEIELLSKSKKEDYLNTLRSSVEEGIASRKTSEIYSNLDRDVMEVSGLKKNSDEKTYDFTKRAINNFKSRSTELESKVQELETKIREGSQDKTLSTQIEALNLKIAENDKEKVLLQSKLLEKDINIEIKEGLRLLPAFKKDLPKDVIDEFVSGTINKLTQTAKIENGKVTFYNGDKPILNDKAQVATAEDILKDRLKSIIDPGRKQEGAGSGSDNGKDKGGFVRIATVPAGITHQGQLIDHMVNMGYIKNSKDYLEDYAKLSKELKFR